MSCIRQHLDQNVNVWVFIDDTNTGTRGETNETDEVQTSLRWRDGLEPPRWEELGKETREQGRANEADDRQVCSSKSWAGGVGVESEGEVKPTHTQRGGQRSTKKQQGREEQKKTEQISNNMTVTMATWSVSMETVTDCRHCPIKLVGTLTDQCQSLLYSTPPATFHPLMMMPFCCQQHDFMQNQRYCWQICVWTSFPLSWIWTHFRHFRWNSSVHGQVGGQGLLNSWWGKPNVFGAIDFFPSLHRNHDLVFI